LKQGPAPVGRVDGNCDEECRLENSSHWKEEMRIKDISLDTNEKNQFELSAKDRWFATDTLRMFIFSGDCYHGMSLDGTKLYTSKVIDPLTIVVLKVRKISSDEEFVNLTRDILGSYIENPEIFERNLLKPESTNGLQTL